MKKLLAVLVVAILSFSLYFAISRYKMRRGNFYYEAIQYNAKTRDLKKERLEIVNKIADMEDDFIVPNLGSVIVLLTDTKEKQLDNAISQLDRNGYHGVIAISKKELTSNNREYMDMESIKRLLEKDYEIVIKVEKGEDPKEIYNDFIDSGLEIKGFYYTGEMNKEIIESIKETGCNVVIGSNYQNEDDDILYINKYGNMTPSIKNVFYDSIENSSTFAISVGYEGVLYEQYSEDNFNSMFKVINPYVENDSTSICNITEAQERKNYLDEYSNELFAQQKQEISDMKNRLDEIDKDLLSID